MYALYGKRVAADQVTYQHRTDVSLFGCNAGYIPRFVRKAMPQRQSEPYKWHVHVHDALANAGEPEAALIIDINPYSKQSNYVTLCELHDVWGFSHFGWTPALVHLRVVLERDDSTGVNKQSFTADRDSDLPVYSIWYFAGSVNEGSLTGTWNPPGPSSTNSALLWPEAMTYFLTAIAGKTPELMPC